MALKDAMGKFQAETFPLVNVHITMEHHCFKWVNMGKSPISMALFNSYVGLPEGCCGGTFRFLWPLVVGIERSRSMMKSWGFEHERESQVANMEF